MKFCPQCGTTFEPGARFCLECGFDKSSVEPEPAPVETPPSEPAKAQGCPQCGGALDPADRFCQECGFDTINIKYSRPEVAQPLPLPVEENIISPPPTPVEPVFSTAANQFCQQCGTIMAAGERFCSGCGFDTKADPAKPVPMEQPAVMPRPEPRAIPPVNPPTAPQPARTQASSYAQVSQPPPIQKKSRKSWLSIVLIVAGLAILGAGGWYGYNRFIAKPVTETALPEPITPAEQPVSQPAAPDVNSEQATEPEAAPAKQASSDKKPLS
ncbi:MAG: zinc ribbon domain-containing protein, partial [Bacteroidota bacterium]